MPFQDPPTSLLESAPPQPTLNVLIIEGKDTLRMPDGLIKQWSLDSRFGARFKVFLDELVQEFGKAPLLLHPWLSCCSIRGPCVLCIRGHPSSSQSVDSRLSPFSQDSGLKRSLGITEDPQTSVAAGLAPSPVKRTKLDLDMMPVKDLPGPVVMDVPMVSVKGKGVKLVLSIRPHDMIFLLNMGAGEAGPLRAI